jgi:hypothetical protein
MTLESVLIGLLSLYVLIPWLRILSKCRSVWISTYSVGIVSLISCETGSTGITSCDPSRKRWMSTCRWRGRNRWDILVVLVVCWPYSVPNVKRGTSIGTRAYPGDEGGLPASPKHYILCNHRSSSIPSDDGLPASPMCSIVWLFLYAAFDRLTNVWYWSLAKELTWYHLIITCILYFEISLLCHVELLDSSTWSFVILWTLHVS